MCSLWRNLVIFALFRMRVTKVSSFWPPRKICIFMAKSEFFWLGMDVTRWLKAKIAKNVFTLTKFGDFGTILHESHQS